MILSLLAALVLAAVHFLTGRLQVLDDLRRRRWLSAAGGVSVAYVFIHLLPLLAAGQDVMSNAEFDMLDYLEHHAYLLALAGLMCFYGLECMIQRHRNRLPDQAESHAGLFWLHIASFAGYNALIGYILVHRESPAALELVWFTVAMGLHLLVNDFALQSAHNRLYRRCGRWVLAAAVLVGWALGTATEVSELAVAALAAFVAGGIILNVLKEELPEENNGHVGAFIGGAAAYAIVLLVV